MDKIKHLMIAQQELAYAKNESDLPEEAIIHIQIAQRNIVEAIKECEHQAACCHAR